MSAKYAPKTAFGWAVHHAEETAIAATLGVMTLITFVNVVLRYVFAHSMIWGLEATLILFAWLVLLGMSYAVKVTAHLGVDAVLGMVGPGMRRILAIISAVLCLVYAFLLLKGAWDYWAPFGGFEQTGGRWFPEGFIKTRDQAWYETETIPMPDWLRFIEGPMNEGEAYNKLPRFIPYFILPFGTAMLFFRIAQATWDILRGRRDALIVSHEAEEAVAEVRHMNAED